jgi:hypothetical protein
VTISEDQLTTWAKQGPPAQFTATYDTLRRTARSGKDSIDHGPGGHDDLANSVAGVADLIASRTQPLVVTTAVLARAHMPPGRSMYGGQPKVFFR